MKGIAKSAKFSSTNLPAIFVPCRRRQRLAMSSSLVFISKTRDSGPIVYDTASQEIVGSACENLANPYRSAASSGGELFVATDNTHSTYVFTGSSLDHAVNIEGPASTAAFSHDDKYLAIGGMKCVRLLEMITGSDKFSEVKSVDAAAMWMLCFSPSDLLLLGTVSHSAVVWSIPELVQICSLDGHGSGLQCAAFLNDSVAVTGSDDRRVRVWDVASCECTKVLNDCEGWVTALAVASDGSMFATGSDDDATVRIWDGAAHLLVRAIVCSSGIYSLAFVQDNKKLVAGIFQNPFVVIDVASGAIEHSFMFSAGFPYCISSSAGEGCHVISVFIQQSSTDKQAASPC